MERSVCGSSTGFPGRGLRYVEVLLQGGAPWGFTLKGGLEHGEPLIISKVEEGGKAGLLEHPLEPGDQVVNINEVELSGSRQEAISLVKGSYKTLRLTVARECSLDPCCSEPALPPPVGTTQNQGHSQDNRGYSGGVKLRIRNRRSEPGSRPHSWHSTKLGEGQQDPSMMQISQGGIGTPWHRTCQSSASTTDLSSYDPGYLRKSPDQYSSRGSMESLDHGHPSYSSCHQLSSSKSSNSIDHLHNKRDSAYSSFSTSSSIPEYPTAAPSFSKERSYSMESMLSHRGPEGMRQADIRYVRTVYDPQQGISQEHEVSSAKLLRNAQAEIHGGGLGELATRSSSSSVSSYNSMANHISAGSTWGQATSRNSYENLKGAPAPPLRSDSYAAIKNHERPNSWSSLEQPRSLRALQKGSWTHSSGSVSSAKSSFTAEGQLHTVIEKSPESSPTTRPKQNFPQAPQPGRFMLPTGTYPVPQPEPHFAQVPTSCPSSGTMYPALAKDSMCISHRDQDREGDIINGSTVENRNQSKSPSTSSQIPGFPKPKPSTHHEGRRQEDSNTKFGHYRHSKHSTEEYGVSQVQNQEPSYKHMAQSVVQERRDPYTRVQQRVDRQKHSQSFENSEVQRQTKEEEPVRSPAWTYQLQNRSMSPEAQDTFNRTQAPYGIYRDFSFPTSHGSRGESVQIQKNDSVSKVLPRHHSDTDALQQQQQQQPEHPLTQLENALVQVQRSNSEGPSSQYNSQSESNEIDAMHLSVLERVSRFEQREQRRSQSQCDIRPGYASHSFIRSSQAPTTKASMEDSRNKEGLSAISNSKAWSHSRSQSCSTEGKESMGFENSKECQQYPTTFQLCGSREPSIKNPYGKFLPIQRSKSSYQLGDENGKDFHTKENLEDIQSTIQDSSFNRAYRDSIKDAQTKVLRSTSFRRKDLSGNPSVPSKHLSLERKAPKTSPKPVMTSPHTPKERHIVTPEAKESIPPPLPSVPAVGPPVARIGGRKRIALEQKKRSYSEPEKMHELGLSDSEDSQRKTPQQFFFPETSVADKRKLFEIATTNTTGLNLSGSRPELKQIQQDALVDYMERKTGRRAARCVRPTSAYLQHSSSDSQSISSASSFASLQDPNLLRLSQSDSHPETNHLPTSLKGNFNPNENSAQIYSLNNNASHNMQQEAPLELFGSEVEIRKSSPAPSSEHLQSKLPFQNQSRSFERMASPRSSGKSASAEDLLERSEEPKLIPQHFRSRSSPSEEKIIKTAVADHSVFGMFSKEPLLSGPSSRFVRNTEQDRPAATTYRMEKYMQNQGSSQLNPPVIRKEKQRLAERQRVQSAMGLAASVGLPCSFSPPPSSTQLDWQASDRRCQANMDALAFTALPFRAQGQAAPGGFTSQSSAADISTKEETVKEVQWECSTSQVFDTTKVTSISRGKGQKDDPSAPCRSLNGPAGASQEPLCQTESSSPTELQRLPSLHISESNLNLSPSTQLTKEDDDVFLEDPGPPTPPAPPCVHVQKTELTDFPPLPPLTAPTENEQGYVDVPPGHQHLNRTLSQTALDSSAAEQLQSLSSSSATSGLPSTPVTKSPSSAEGKAQSLAGSAEEVESGVACEDQKGVEEDLVLCRRQRSLEELRVEALSRELVSRDKSLTPILGTWAVKSTVDLMEDIFPTGVQLPQQQRESSWTEDRRQEQNSTAGDMHLQRRNRGMETDLDEEEADLNLKKAELVEALTLSVTALRGERETLAEEQRKFSELGNHIEALVQEHCKPNECEKYRMFVGDLDKIVNLLLSLCGRLARVENTLSTLEGQDSEDSSKEREALQQKRNQLCGQHEDARELKENLDRRQRVVLDILAGYLSAQQLCDYKRFVRTKPALLIRQRCLDDLIRQGEEQLQWLGETFQPAGWERGAGESSSPRSTTVTSL